MRRYPLALLLLFLAHAASAAGTGSPRIGLVLAGGGAKGAAHIGVLKVLEELRIPVHAIAGTSMGSLVGGAYAAGLSATEMEQAVTSVNWNELFDDDPPRAEWPMRRKEEDLRPTFDFTIGQRGGKLRLPKGAMSGQEVLLFLSDLVKGSERVERFDDLPIPFRAVATDLETGEMVVFDRAPLPFAMRASMAVPGVFAPLETDDRIYVDGGLVRNFPVDVVHTLGVDVVIGVKLEANPPTREQISSVLGTAAQMINILIAQNEQVSLGEMDPKRDVLVTPQLGDIGGGDFARAAEAIATGVEAARRASAQLARYSVSEAEYAAWREAAANRLASVERIDAVRVEGLKRVNPKLFAPLVETHQGRALERPRLEQDLSRLYGHGDFERVSYRFEREAGRDLLIVDAVEKGWGPGYLSFGLGIATDFSGDNRFGLRGTYRHTWVNNLGAEWMSELTTGNDARLFSEFYQPLDADRLAFVAPYVDVSRAPFGVFLEDQRVARYELTRARAGVDVGTTVKSAAELRVGVYTGVADAEVDTGSPLVPEVNANESGFRARLLYDTRDSGGAPRTGRLLLGEVRAPTPALGAEDEYARTEVAGGAAFSSGPNTILLKGLGGTSFGEEMPYYDQFPLGGFLELSGYANEQFRGNEYAFGSVVYYRQLASLPPPIGRGLYLGGSLEVGRLWGVFEGLNPEKTRYGGSLFFAADTWLGPAYLGLGLSGEGDTAVYFLLGNP